MALDFVSVHKHTKKELGQYPAILTSHLVNNPYLFKIGYWPRCVYGLHPNLELGQYAAKYRPNAWSIISVNNPRARSWLACLDSLKWFLVVQNWSYFWSLIEFLGVGTLPWDVVPQKRSNFLRREFLSRRVTSFHTTNELECKSTLTQTGNGSNFNKYFRAFSVRASRWKKTIFKPVCLVSQAGAAGNGVEKGSCLWLF